MLRRGSRIRKPATEMRILVVNYEFPPVGGGGGVACRQLARQWAREHSVDCITSRAPGLPAKETVEGVRVYRVPVPGRRGLEVAPLASLVWYPAAGLLPGLSLHALHRYDVINTHFAVPSGLLGVPLSLLCRVPNVLSVHGGDLYDPTKRLSPHRFPPAGVAVRAVLRASAALVAQSSDTARNALRYYGEDLREKLHVVPLPYDPPDSGWLEGGRQAARRELHLDSGRFYAVSVGRMVERKGFDRLIDSLLKLPPAVRLVLVGSGPLERVLRAQVKRSGLGGRVSLVGRVDERTKYRYLLAADCYVLSSHHEGFGIVLQEAMWAGLPIVATTHGGQTGFLRDGENALLISSNAPGRIAEAVRALMEDPALRSKLSGAARPKLEEFRPARIAARYIELFREVVAS